MIFIQLGNYIQCEKNGLGSVPEAIYEFGIMIDRSSASKHNSVIRSIGPVGRIGWTSSSHHRTTFRLELIK